MAHLAATGAAVGTVVPGVGTAVGGAIGGLTEVVTGLFGGASPRSGGADPCCSKSGPYGVNPGLLAPNRNQGGAPPDFRDLGQPSPSGVGRLKDDACDCVPIEWPAGSGKFWILDGGVGGSGAWIGVTAAGAPVRVGQAVDAAYQPASPAHGFGVDVTPRPALQAGFGELFKNPFILAAVAAIAVLLVVRGQ